MEIKLTDSGFKVLGHSFETGEEVWVLMMFRDGADKCAADNDAVSKMCHLVRLLWCRNTKSDSDRFFGHFLNGLHILFDEIEIGELRTRDAG